MKKVLTELSVPVRRQAGQMTGMPRAAAYVSPCPSGGKASTSAGCTSDFVGRATGVQGRARSTGNFSGPTVHWRSPAMPEESHCAAAQRRYEDCWERRAARTA